MSARGEPERPGLDRKGTTGTLSLHRPPGKSPWRRPRRTPGKRSSVQRRALARAEIWRKCPLSCHCGPQLHDSARARSGSVLCSCHCRSAPVTTMSTFRLAHRERRAACVRPMSIRSGHSAPSMKSTILQDSDFQGWRLCDGKAAGKRQRTASVTARRTMISTMLLPGRGNYADHER